MRGKKVMKVSTGTVVHVFAGAIAVFNDAEDVRIVEEHAIVDIVLLAAHHYADECVVLVDVEEIECAVGDASQDADDAIHVHAEDHAV